ncbi:hypothetical protein FACS189476_09910 [Spirochaetia bacterium]|nr:hypothetical protein FACS189476_09910 [Spirochaetia bacterium]
MKFELLVHSTNSQRLESIKKNGLWATRVSNTKDISERFEYKINVLGDISDEKKDFYKKDFIERFEASVFWLNFTKIDIEIASPQEGSKNLLQKLMGNEHLKAVLMNLYRDKTLGEETIDKSIVIFKPLFDKKVKEITGKFNITYCDRKLKYTEEVLYQRAPLEVEFCVESSCIEDKICFTKPFFTTPNNVLCFKKSKKGPNDEWYFGEDEYRYLFYCKIDNCDKNRSHIAFPLDECGMADIPRFEYSIMTLKDKNIYLIKTDGTNEKRAGLETDTKNEMVESSGIKG